MEDHHHTVPPLVRPAIADDVGHIHALIAELAEFEQLSEAMQAGVEDLAAALFAPQPRVFCDMVEGQGGRVMGCSVWFYTYSTFRGRHGIWIEDLYVRPAFRRLGAGRALLAEAARRCVAENMGRLEWSVLDWNQDAIAFYKAEGATMMEEWTTCRVESAALWRLADKARPRHADRG